MSSIPQTPKAPSLPFAEVQYSRNYLDQLNNVLRLYFNQIDNTFASLLSIAGGSLLESTHGCGKNGPWWQQEIATFGLWGSSICNLAWAINTSGEMQTQICVFLKTRPRVARAHGLGRDLPRHWLMC